MSARASREKITADLTESQREAVTWGEGPLLVVAGAGSGKTRVITRRIAWLLAEGVAPERLIAITFTNKAADEMRRRVEAMIGRSVHVSTFHSFCARLLRREIERLGMGGNFTIYDRGDSIRLARRIVREMNLDDASFTPAGLIEYIGARKDRIMTPEDCMEKAIGFIGRKQAEAYAIYQRRLAESDALDFDDLLLRTIEVFSKAPEALQHYQEKYVHVLVDEYQDTNLPQHLIARALQGRHRNITAVGDPDQTIYTWRGARLENLMEFEEDFPGAHTVLLERNYRSSANILRASGALIRCNRYRHEKNLWTNEPPGAPVMVRRFPDSHAEAEWLAGKVAGMIEAGVEPTQIAVFYRTKQQSAAVETAFAQRTLPYQVVDSTRVLDRRGVRDLRAYLQLLINPKDAVACLRAINTPARGIGARTVEKLQATAEKRGCSLMEAARDADEIDSLGPRARGALHAFWDLYVYLTAFGLDRVEELVRELAERIDYVNRQSVDERVETRETLDLWFADVARYETNNPDGGLAGYLEQVALISDVDGWKGNNAAVPLMTLHSAKGLEFDHVFLVGVEEDILPHRRAVEDRAHGTAEQAVEEERRLFYVGMTRARRELFVTWADYHVAAGREYRVGPSRFLDELPDEGVERSSEAPPRAARGGGPGLFGPGYAPGRGYADEVRYVLKRKSISLTILDGADGDSLAAGVGVSHPQFGDGEIVSVGFAARRLMVKVNFLKTGTMTLLLAAEDVAVRESDD